MSDENPIEDYETESRVHGYKLEDGSNFRDPRRPAKIVVKIKFEEDDDQTNKRTLSRTGLKRNES